MTHLEFDCPDEKATVLLRASRLFDEGAEIGAVRRGEWVQEDDYDEEANVYRCSLCGEDWVLNAGNPVDNNMNYCPMCGAKMYEKGDS